MFSLIITIVSIALVVALVAATMYYGGDTLTQGRDRADAAAFVSGGQQISGAIQMFRAMEGALPDDLDELQTEKYLTSLPTVKSTDSGAWGIDLDEALISVPVGSETVCAAIDKQAGGDGETLATDLATDATFGCYGAGTDFTFAYRY